MVVGQFLGFLFCSIVSEFVSVPYCLDDYSFVIELEIRNRNASSFVFLVQDCFGYSGSFGVLHKF